MKADFKIIYIWQLPKKSGCNYRIHDKIKETVWKHSVGFLGRQRESQERCGMQKYFKAKTGFVKKEVKNRNV